MIMRMASCRCGQLNATATGEPVRVSVCHCLDCKKRSGSAFAVQARWPADQVTIEGRSNSWVNVADSGNRIPIFEADVSLVSVYDPSFRKRLQGSIHMHGRQSDRIGQLLLRQRQFEALLR